MLSKIKVGSKKLYCGLDIGTQNIKAGILELRDKDAVEIIGAYESKTHGLRDGVVSDLAELSECVSGVLQNLTKKTGFNIRDIILCVGSEIVKFREAQAALPLVERGTKEISIKNINDVNLQARLLGTELEEEIIHDIPQIYNIDDAHNATNPLGLFGRRLGVRSLLIAADAKVVRNIVKAINQAGYDVSNIVFGSYVSAEICTSDKERNDGVIVVDMGAAQTKIVAIKDKMLQYCSLVDMGGNKMTSDISDALKVSFDLAEEIKKSYAAVTPTQHYHHEEILVKNENVYLPVKKDLIYQSIKDDVDTLIDGICESIQNSGLAGKIDSGIVITGGGALMPGIIEKLNEQASIPVKIGRLSLNDQQKLGKCAIFSSAFGAAYFTYLKQKRTAVTKNYNSIWEQMACKLKDFYQDYF